MHASRFSSRGLGDIVVLGLALLAPLGAGALQQLNPAGAGAFQQFGGDVAMSGDVAVIGLGSQLASAAGAAHVFRFNGTQWVEEQKLTASDGGPGDRFGRAVDVDGDLAVIGAGATTGSLGSVYVFRFNGSSWVEEQKLLASDGEVSDLFGYAVAIQGDHIVAGAPIEGGNPGAVYSFRWNGSSWVEEQKFTQAGSVFFGLDLDLDGLDGSRFIVGTAGAIDAAYVYRWNGSSWALEQTLAGFNGQRLATAVTIYGESLLAGAVGVASPVGAACAYRFDASTWQPEQCFTAADGIANDGFGTGDLALFENQVAVSRAPFEEAFVFERIQEAGQPAVWQIERRTRISVPAGFGSEYGEAVALASGQMIVGAPENAVAGSFAGVAFAIDLSFDGFRVSASDLETLDGLGAAISFDGSRVIAGARTDEAGTDSGSVYIFRREGGGFVEEQKLTASDAETHDKYGTAVAISGDVALVGAHQEDTGGINAGAAYLLSWNGSSWSEDQKLQIDVPTAGDFFGEALALDGDTAAIGADFDDDMGANTGSVTVFRDGGASWMVEQKLLASDPEALARFGDAVDLDGDLLVAGATYADGGVVDSGAAYVFRRAGTSWSAEQKLTAVDGALDDQFGHAVAGSGDVVAVGAPYDDDAGPTTGAVYTYRWNGASWQAEPKLTASDAQGSDAFGVDVALQGDDLLIGTLRGFFLTPARGTFYHFQWNGSAWLEIQRFEAPDGVYPKFGDNFGASVDLAGSDFCVSADRDDTEALAGGSLYFFGNGVCGDGILELGEACDDGNTIAGDCCDASCQLEAGPGSPPCCSQGVCQVAQSCGSVCFAPGFCQLGGAGGTQCLCGP